MTSPSRRFADSPPELGQVRSLLQQLVLQQHLLALQSLEVEHPAVGGFQFLPGGLASEDHLLDRAAVLPLQAVDQVEPFPQLGEAVRIVLDLVLVGRQAPAEFLERGAGIGIQPLDFGRPRIDADQVVDLPRQAAQRLHEGSIVPVHHRMERGRQLDQLLGMLQPAGLKPGALVFSRGQAGRLDLARPEFQKVRSLARRRRFGRDLGDAAAQPRQSLVGRARAARGVGGARERVQDVALGVAPEEGLVLVLAVQIDQMLAQLPDQARRGR